MVSKLKSRKFSCCLLKFSKTSEAEISVISSFPMEFFSQYINLVKATPSLTWAFMVFSASVLFFTDFISSVGFSLSIISTVSLRAFTIR